MARTKKAMKQEQASPGTDDAIYDMRTPRWSAYYDRIRKSVRYPRYYKKALNW